MATDPKQPPHEPRDAHDHPLPEVGEPMPPADFTTFILSLASATLIDLGELEGPDGHKHAPSLAMARHHIDLVAMLADKTRGNLTGEEERLLHQVTADLKGRFIRAAEASKKS